ncbi:MAG: hypothetical protein J6S41_07765 [Clostridia bacterium]|nr:hypothetical protein [Clostridia bacterium]
MLDTAVTVPQETEVSEGAGETAPAEAEAAAETPPATQTAADETAEPGTTPDGVADEGAGEAAEEPFATYRYNHRTYSVNAENARPLLQKGRKYDELVPQLNELYFLAESRKQTFSQFVEDLKTSFANSSIKTLRETHGCSEEAARELHEARMTKLRGGFKGLEVQAQDEAKQDEQDLTARMGNEFSELQKEFPDVRELKDLPKSVLKQAVEEELHLVDAYLRHLHRNQKKTAAALQHQEASAAASVGDMRSQREEKDLASSDFSQSFWSAF